jgi:undecaprenyl-phosphate 4-deoxy-4-formamido-L-arabinose transferase
MYKLSFVIPCYGSEHTIIPVVHEVIPLIDTRRFDYEFILVNDCSKDNVWHSITKLVEENPKIKGISFARNFGQQSALLAGFRHATGDFIISMDDDGQAPVDSLNEMIDLLIKGDYDIVYGCYQQVKQSGFRRFGSWFNHKMAIWFSNCPKDLFPTSFYVARKFLIEEISRFENCYAYISGLVFRSTRNIGKVEVKHRSRLEGQSGYTLKRLIGLWVNGFTAFSVKPLRLATFLGFGFSIVGFIYGLVVIIMKLLHPDVPIGYSSIMATLLFIGGVLMFIMGMVGEYIGRIYINQNKSPQYVVRAKLNFDNADDICK